MNTYLGEAELRILQFLSKSAFHQPSSKVHYLVHHHPREQGAVCYSLVIVREEKKRNYLKHFLVTPYHLLWLRRRLLPQQIKMSGLMRTITSRAAPVLRGHAIIQRANLQTRPAKEKIGAVVSLCKLTRLDLMLTV